MLVEVEALVPFVTMLGEDMVSVIRGDKVALPKTKAKQLVDAEYAKFVEVQEPPAAPVENAPDNKSAGASPEVKTQQRPSRKTRSARSTE